VSIGQSLRRAGIRFVCGVPDSLMREILDDIEREFTPNSFLVACNEGSAIGLAMGHHLATGELPLVFLQNSGLGNAINPLVSLVDSLVYSVPLMLLIGWRAEIDDCGGQSDDEPQHLRQGLITLKQLELLNIPYFVLESSSDEEEVFQLASRRAVDSQSAVAIVVRKRAQAGSRRMQLNDDLSLPTREELVKEIGRASYDPQNGVAFPVIATTGMVSRELLEFRHKSKSEEPTQDFLTVGGMGHAISIASMVARNLHPKKVICIDGDGAALMHMGALLVAAKQGNLIHIVLDNGVHDSVGGQKTGSRSLDWSALAKTFRYVNVSTTYSSESLGFALREAMTTDGSTLIHAWCSPGHRPDLGRPKNHPQENKQSFMNFLSSLKVQN